MQAKPKKLKIRLIILIIIASLTQSMNALLGQCDTIFSNADEDHANWPSTLTNLATHIEHTELTLTNYDLSGGELTALASGIQEALDSWRRERGGGDRWSN